MISNLQVLFAPGDTVEMRCVGNRTINGFYRDLNKLSKDAAALNYDFNPQQNVYVCLNPVQPELYARSADRFGPTDRGGSVKDNQVVCRRWLLVDIDPVRPSGVSATDQQKQMAQAVATQVYTWLCQQLGKECLVCADSGNGSHILIRLADLPANNETRWVCERFLTMLSDRFSNDQAQVDKSTFNAARICTCYGTIKRKGSDIPEQPHRLSKLVYVPDPLQPADWQTMAGLVDPFPGKQPAQPSTNGQALIDIPQLLQQRKLEYFQDDQYQTQSGEIASRFVLDVCPFNTEHTDRSAVITQWPSNGAVAFKCHHDGCTGKDWPSLRQLWAVPAAEITADNIIFSAPAVQELVIVKSQDIIPEPIDWLWQDRLVVGGINLCAGRGGIGKTYFICDLVARITNPSLTAPDGQPIRHGRVLYATGEDHIAKVIEPRMQQHGVNRSQLEYIKGFPDGKYIRLLDVIEHCDLLRNALQQRPDTVALVLDPISSFQGSADSNKVAQVRQFTAVLTQLAEEFDIALLGIHHFNKGKRDHAGDSISGSHAYRDASRAIWLFALDKDDRDRRLMVCDKNNWAEKHPPGLAYRITAGRIQYEAERLEMTSDELMGQRSQQQLDVANSWLAAQLSAGPQTATDMQIAATMAGISNVTLRRAKKSLGVVSKQESNGWYWSLPETLGQAKE
jgi:AAA domain-containing protein